MRAVILAAGRGSRLGEGIPKCLLRLGRHTLLETQIHLLRSVGVEQIAVITGYGAEQVEKAGGVNCHYIHNPRFAQTNSLYSLWLARHWVKGPFFQVNCDVVAHLCVYQKLARARGTVLAYDSTSGKLDEQMKVRIAGGKLLDISKQMDPIHSSGENLGILKYDRAGAQFLFNAADELIAAGDERAWAPAAVGRMTASYPVRCLDVAGIPWAEIDFVEDALYARYEIWPAVRPARRRSIAARLAGGVVGAGAHLVKSLGALGGMLDGML